ncbi:MAG TPA: SGNH/GDSL hydrolase family protein [Nocardioidaceae bacterium]|nr:SGNH/GDSL hydrolase family protein [Nocardioidaceae bacterium]
MPGYVRFAALGDSTTYGIGDPVPNGWRGWARLLADAMGQTHDVSFCNLAVSGATAPVVRRDQLDDALAHRPDLASLIVGVNDTMRSSWDPVDLRTDLLTCAEALHGIGAVLMTTRFHDHGAVLGLPGVLRRPLWRRIEHVNAVYDEIFEMYGGVRLDLVGRPEVGVRDFWSVDRLHPSELGHRRLAYGFGALVKALGVEFTLPSLALHGGLPSTRWADLRWMVTEGAPWMGRRAKDLGPWAARRAMPELRVSSGSRPLSPRT